MDQHSTLNKVTRIAAADDGTWYDPVAIALHWTTVVLVIVQMLLAQLWGVWGRPTHHLMVAAHMSLGIILAAVIVARIVWRLIPGHQVASVVAGAVELASKGVHYLLYLLLSAEAVLGFLLRWSGGEDMSFFGLPIPPPFAEWSRAANHRMGEFHEWNGWLIIVLAFAHAAAALYHHYGLHDRVLLRMLPGGRKHLRK